MRILVAEAKWTGHHLFLAREVATELAVTDHDIVLATTADDQPSAREMRRSTLDDLDPRIDLRPVLDGPKAGFSHIRNDDSRVECDAIGSAARDVDPDLVILPSGDAVGYALGHRRDHPLNTRRTKMILHQPYVGYGGRGWKFALRRESIRRRLRRLRTSLAALDHRIADALHPHRTVTMIPNPPMATTERTREAARAIFDIADDQLVFLAAGEHSLRKGTHRLVSNWPDAANTVLFIVGRCSDDVRAAVDSRRRNLPDGRIRVLDEVLDNQRYGDAFRAADVVTVCYPMHFGASGILNTAIAYRKPVIGSDYGCIGDLVEPFGIGTSFDCRDEATMRTNLRKSVASPPRFDEQLAQPLIDFHTQENLGTTIRSWILGPDESDRSPLPYPARS